NVAGFPVLMDGADSELVSESTSAMNLGAFTAKSGVLTVNSAFDKPITFASATIDGEGYTVAGIAPDGNTTITGNVLLKGGIFSIGGNGPVNLAGVTIDPTATAVGIATPAGNVNFGTGINGSAVTAASFNFAKGGQGRFMATAGTFAANSMTKAVMDVHEGTMTMIGEGAWAGSNNVVFSGGMLEISGATGTLAPGPYDAVGQWLGGSGNTLADSAGGNDGVIAGAEWVNDPVRGWVLDFDANGQVVIPGSAFTTVGDAITVALWVYGDTTQPRNQTTFQGKIGGVGGARAVGSHLPWSNSNVYWDAGGADSCCNDRSNQVANLTDFAGQWNHWAFTKDTITGEQKMFLNGVQWHSATGRYRKLDGIDVFFLGSEGDANYYDGMLDDLVIFDRALSEAEIAQVAAGQFGELTGTGPINMPNRNFTVTENSGLRVAANSVATFGSLTVENGTLGITGGATQVNFTGGTSVTGDGGVNLGIITDFGNTVVEEGARLTLDGYGPVFEATNDPNPQVLIKAGGVLHSRADSTSLALPVNVLGASGDLPGGQLILDGFGSEIVVPVTIGPGGLLALGGGEATFSETVVIGAGGTLSVGGTEGFFLAPVTIGDNATLSVTGTGNIFADSVAIHDGAQVLATGQADFSKGVTIVGPAAQVGFDGSATVDFGAINGGGIQDLVVAKVGAGTWPLSNAGSHLTNMGPNSKLSVAEGVLKLTGEVPTGGALIELSGGTLECWGAELAPLEGPAGAVLRLDFDSSGTLAVDSSASARVGVINGNLTWAEDGIQGGAMQLDGNSYILFPAGDPLLASKSFSTAFWAKRDTTNGDFVIGQGDTTGNDQVLQIGFRDANQFTQGFYGNDQNYSNSAAVNNIEDWHFWTTTFDLATNQQLIYMDGQLVNTRTAARAGFLGSGANDLSIGRRWDGNGFAGMLDDLRIYESVLTAEQVNELYGGGLGPHALLPAVNFAAQDISVIGDSTLNLMTEETGSFRALTFAGDSTLSVTGLATGVNFTATNVSAGLTGGINAEMPVSGGPLTIGDGGTFAMAGSPGTFTTLTVGDGTTVITGAPTTFTSTTLPDGAQLFTIQADAATALGPITAQNSPAVTINKIGLGTATVSGASQGLDNATLIVEEGAMQLGGVPAWGGLTGATLRGGTLQTLTQAANLPMGYPLAYWGFNTEDPATATVALDGSGHGLHATMIDNDPADALTVAFTPDGIAGQAMEFPGGMNSNDGTRTYLDAPDGFADFTGGISVSAWVNVDTFNNWARIIDFGNGQGVDNILLARRGTSDDGRLEFDDTLGGNESKDWNNTWVTGQWQHIVATCNDGPTNAATMRIYINGNQVASWADGSVPAVVTRVNNYIGRSNYNDAIFDGRMDELYLFDREVSPAEVAALYAQGLAGVVPDISTPGDLDLSDKLLTVEADSVLDARVDGKADFGPLTFAADGVLTATGAGGGINFASTTVLPDTAGGVTSKVAVTGGPLTLGDGSTLFIGGGAGAGFNGTAIVSSLDPPDTPFGVTLDINGPVQFGLIDANDYPVTITNTSSSGGTPLIVDWAPVGMANASWVVRDGGVTDLVDANALSGAPIAVGPGGTLRLTEINQNSAIELAGGRLDLPGTVGLMDIPNALTHYGYMEANVDSQLQDIANGSSGGLLAVDPAGVSLFTQGPRGLDFNNDGEWRAALPGITRNDNFQNLFLGTFTAAHGDGNYQFKIEQDDDRAVMLLDLNQDGIFQAANGEQLAWDTDHNWKTVSLLADEEYLVAFGHMEGGGGSGMEIQFRTPLMPGRTRVRPGAAKQEGLWTAVDWLAAAPVDAGGLVATVTADSTINSSTDFDSTLPSLNMQEGIVTVTGAATTIPGINILGEASGKIVGLDPQTDVTLGPITGNLVDATFRKAGSGSLTLEDPNTGLDNAIIDVNGGELVIKGSQSWGNSTQLRLSGGTAAISDVLPGALMGSGVAPEGALGVWTFDDGTVDEADGRYISAMVGTPLITDADVPAGLAGGKSIDFRGGNNAVTVDTNVDGADPNQNTFDVDRMTVAFWLKGWPDGNWNPFVSKYGEGSQGWQIRRGDNWQDRIVFTMRGAGGDWWTEPPSDAGADEWHHVVATYDGSRQELYVDGELLAGTNRTGNINDSGSVLVFGARDTSDNAGNAPNMDNWAHVQMDDIYIYDRGLSASEISAMLYATETPDVSAVDVTVDADSTLRSDSAGLLAFDQLILNNGTVTVSGSGPVSFSGFS
ncbi:MAG TPA: LamG-like jellyroll fold domain-containing protein, partial [Thermoguttaceae bacterium]|nr:LamG-like jellyroll fold domain-containing protein [Thermoguttaceae bacterium]